MVSENGVRDTCGTCAALALGSVHALLLGRTALMGTVRQRCIVRVTNAVIRVHMESYTKLPYACSTATRTRGKDF